MKLKYTNNKKAEQFIGCYAKINENVITFFDHKKYVGRIVVQSWEEQPQPGQLMMITDKFFYEMEN